MIGRKCQTQVQLLCEKSLKALNNFSSWTSKREEKRIDAFHSHRQCESLCHHHVLSFSPKKDITDPLIKVPQQRATPPEPGTNELLKQTINWKDWSWATLQLSTRTSRPKQDQRIMDKLWVVFSFSERPTDTKAHRMSFRQSRPRASTKSVQRFRFEQKRSRKKKEHCTKICTRVLIYTKEEKKWRRKTGTQTKERGQKSLQGRWRRKARLLKNLKEGKNKRT